MAGKGSGNLMLFVGISPVLGLVTLVVRNSNRCIDLSGLGIMAVIEAGEVIPLEDTELSIRLVAGGASRAGEVISIYFVVENIHFTH